ncbi:mismatch repair endonuclease PMS2 [Anopheles ziemanni]|uniref:mismatch repair endonuclease PMS2 n=1 Tax=Anopheles coustani TaxID=139045 RepID=UPI002658538E|nr:mismatch repair endonuclease PMS2 [Anopheles coustani]XP_058174009.1 mismatch repair endonuclease PMS2 [Anopheles ziemanni]
MAEESETTCLPATNAESRKINVIDKETVHKICSGQVVLNLAVAVKELVENSLDAGATLIEVKLRDHGAELVEVSDNGSGVEEKNFQGLTAKYHTSKLKEFSDLESIETFGFRGEALSSLCALSDMVITTRHCSAGHATKLTLNHEGRIQTQTPCARPIGTTVTLTNLFSTLPVRKKEFQRNIKKEFLRMCQILQAYCLVSTGVRIICSNQTSKGAKSVIMSTHGSSRVLDNVTALFGPKQTAELMELKPAIGNNGKLQDLDASDFDDSIALTQEEVDNFNLSKYTIEGYISSCAHGSGRGSKDRQFFFINSRPCEPKQISKLVNDAYHRYNVHQHPFVYLNLQMERSEVDVNLTPDKRQVLVNNEKILLLAVRKSIKKTFGNVPSSFKVQNLNLSDSSRLLNISLPPVRDDDEEQEDMSIDEQRKAGSVDKCSAGDLLFTFEVPKHVPSGTGGLKRKRNSNGGNGLQKIKDFLEASRSAGNSEPVGDGDGSQDEDEMRLLKQPKSETNPYDLTILKEPALEDDPVQDAKESVRVIRCTQSASNELLSMEDPALPTGKESNGTFSQESVTELVSLMSCKPESCESSQEDIKEPLGVKRESSSESFLSIDQFVAAPVKREANDKSLDSDLDQGPTIVIDDAPSEDDLEVKNRNHQLLTISHTSLEQLIERERKLRDEKNANDQRALTRLRFKSKINPASNRAAENELQTEITKTDFGAMKVIGQFNLGFIVARLGDDLFIVDQHATDEKYNFEDLQRTTVLQNQRLVVPQPLELTAVNEMVLIDSLDIFEMNGFKFEIDGAAPTTRKVKLIAKPYSRNWEFGKEDIDELIFMLQEAPNTVCRPSRVRAMFASRACRKSVMIGTALSVREMERLLRHMGEIDQPWNCPHGRPTMRHLVNLAMINQIDNTTEA